MKNLITICARGGSKGIHRKNIKILNGQPLISYTIKIANDFSKLWNADVVLSTDDEEIKSIALQYGLKTNYIRPKFLSGDRAGKIETINDVLAYQETLLNLKYDYILDLDVTSPLRTIEDLKNGFEILKSDINALNLFSVSNPNRNPYFNVVELKNNGYYDVVKKGDFLSRQEAPVVYDMNSSFYFYRKSFFEQLQKKTTSEKSLIYLMPHICFDLDHILDFEFMEYLLSNDKLDY